MHLTELLIDETIVVSLIFGGPPGSELLVGPARLALMLAQ
jgi:hypothetical protein